MIAVADTGPINYLILIGEIALLPLLYRRVFLPGSVQQELSRLRAPETVRAWMAGAPAWVGVRTPRRQPDAYLSKLGAGERDVILLAEELGADQAVMDEFRGRREAIRRRLPIAGTVGILAAASTKGLVNFDHAMARLGQTSFRISRDILDKIRQAQS